MNTRYADDIFLHGKSLEELEHMANLLISELRRFGLRLNSEKTKILHTHLWDDSANLDYIEIADELIRILPCEESHRYLGRLLSTSSSNREEIEFSYRKRQAWRIFHKHKKLLLNSNVSIKKRLRFFDSCVTPAFLFSLSVLPISKLRIKDMDQLQRQMVRRIIGWRRLPEESWKETMSRMNIRMGNSRM